MRVAFDENDIEDIEELERVGADASWTGAGPIEIERGKLFGLFDRAGAINTTGLLQAVLPDQASCRLSTFCVTLRKIR